MRLRMAKMMTTFPLLLTTSINTAFQDNSILQISENSKCCEFHIPCWHICICGFSNVLFCFFSEGFHLSVSTIGKTCVYYNKIWLLVRWGWCYCWWWWWWRTWLCWWRWSWKLPSMTRWTGILIAGSAPRWQKYDPSSSAFKSLWICGSYLLGLRWPWWHVHQYHKHLSFITSLKHSHNA